MSNVLEVLKVIAPSLPEYTSVEYAITLAEKIDRIYTAYTPETWAVDHVDAEYAGKKIQFIKDIRQATECSLVEAKNAAETAIAKWERDQARLSAFMHAPQPWGTPEEPPF